MDLELASQSSAGNMRRQGYQKCFIFRSVTAENKNFSIQCNFIAHIEQVQDK